MSPYIVIGLMLLTAAAVLAFCRPSKDTTEEQELLYAILDGVIYMSAVQNKGGINLFAMEADITLSDAQLELMDSIMSVEDDL